MTNNNDDDAQRRVRLHLTEEQSRIAVACLMVLAAAAIAVGLMFTRAVMAPFVIAAFLAVIVSPLVDWQVNHWRWPRGIAIATALLVVLAVLTVLGLVLTAAVQMIVAALDDYAASVAELTSSTVAELERWRIELDEEQFAEEFSNRALSVMGGAASAAASILSGSGLVVIFVIFMLSGRNPAEAGKTSDPADRTIYSEIESAVRVYIGAKFLISAATGILVWLLLELLGLQLALAFGVLAFLLNFIPNIGSIIATLLPLPAALMQFDSPLQIALVVLLPGALQIVVGNYVEPRVMGHELSLHPVVVLLALALWGLLWGPLGMVLAVPMMASLRITLLRFETTRWLADLLAGKLP